MSTQSFNFPNVALPFINPETGTVDPVWYMFLMQVFRAVGGGRSVTDNAADEALLNTTRAPDLGSINQALAALRTEWESSRRSERGLGDLRATVEGLSNRLASQGNANLQPILSRLDALEALLNTSRRTLASATQAIGDFVTATVPLGSAVALVNNTTANVTSISLTAGDWDLSSTVDFNIANATATLFQGGVSLTSATLASQAGGSGLGTDPTASLPLSTNALAATLTLTQSVSPVRLKITQTTTVYLAAQASFSAGAVSAYGTIRARRAAMT